MSLFIYMYKTMLIKTHCMYRLLFFPLSCNRIFYQLIKFWFLFVFKLAGFKLIFWNKRGLLSIDVKEYMLFKDTEFICSCIRYWLFKLLCILTIVCYAVVKNNVRSVVNTQCIYYYGKKQLQNANITWLLV